MEPPLIPASLTRADYLKWAAEISRDATSFDVRLKVAVLASFTADFWQPYLVVEAARQGLLAEVWFGPYGQIEQQALDPNSTLYQSQADVIILLPRLEDLDPALAWGHLRYDEAALAAARQNLTARLGTVLEALRAQSTARIMLGNFAPPAWCSSGVTDVLLEHSQTGLLQQLNQDLATHCRSLPDAVVLDIARTASEVGLERWRDERLAWLAKAPLSHAALSALGRAAARRIRPWFVPPKKCLVLDLDNTLWGGVLGESGPDGIQLGPDYPGNVFIDFQRRVLALRDQGLLLAVASKNNATDVEQLLATHPACLVKREHFAAFEVHWEDKATSLRRIAAALNIGTDSLVFFDDNPVEREWVHGQLPEVTVLDVPPSPLGYGRLLQESGCFDATAFTEEDRRRAEIYAGQAVREQLRGQSGSLDDFIRSLDMTVTAGHIEDATLPRVAQLLGKTNQFNLTTRRHGPAEIQQMLALGAVGIWVRVSDRFGDNGIVGVAIARPCEQNTTGWIIDTLLMSCRVIGRNVETALLAVLERLVKQRGATTLYGEFLPTAKNQPAADFFERHGFERDSGTPGAILWRSMLGTLRPLPDSFRLTGIDLSL